jgi:hypothetical protein
MTWGGTKKKFREIVTLETKYYNVVLLCGERRVKKHCFHEWGRKKSRVAKATSGFWSPHK